MKSTTSFARSLNTTVGSTGNQPVSTVVLPQSDHRQLHVDTSLDLHGQISNPDCNARWQPHCFMYISFPQRVHYNSDIMYIYMVSVTSPPQFSITYQMNVLSVIDSSRTGCYTAYYTCAFTEKNHIDRVTAVFFPCVGCRL